MAGPYVAFSDLKTGRDVQRIVGRLMRFWDARNVKKGGELMGVDFLLIDEKATIMQGTIHVQHLPKFDELLKEGSLYVVTAFEVTRSNPLTDFHLDQSFYEIPKQFRTHQELVALANTNNELPEVLGQVGEIVSASTPSKVRLTAFDVHATTLNRQMEKKSGETCVMLATNINPKFFAGELYLNATSGTKFYFDSDVEATEVFLASMQKDGTTSAEKHRGVQKIEQVSISELNEFVITSTSQDAEFLCTAKVVDIQYANGWSYISCSKCGKKLTKNQSSLSCNNCNSSSAVGNVRYRVELVVHDGTTSAVFVAFDKDMVKLTNTPAATLAAQMEEPNPELADIEAIPRPLREIEHVTRSREILEAAKAATRRSEKAITITTSTTKEKTEASPASGSKATPYTSTSEDLTVTPKKPKLH